MKTYLILVLSLFATILFAQQPEVINPGGTTIDLNNATPQDVYTVPTGKTLLVIESYWHSPSPGLVGNGETTWMRVIESVAGVILNQSTTSGGPGTFQIARSVTPTKFVVEGNKVQARPDVAYGDEQTVVVVVYGLLF